MTKSPLFSTYRQGENRVTSSMLAVFERIDLSLLETLLSGAAGETGAIQMVNFVNQPVGKGASVPDCRISASFAYWFEVKTERNALRSTQLVEHLANIAESDDDERLFVVTPDASRPTVIDELDDKRVLWFSFRALSDAIEEVLTDARNSVSEQGRFLLRELQALFVEDDLLDTDDVVVVAARLAYLEVAGLVKAPISVKGSGLNLTLTADGVGEGRGQTFKNPVTGESHEAQIVLPDGFIWQKGECGVGSFSVKAEGLSLSFEDSNWIYYEFDWADDR